MSWESLSRELNLLSGMFGEIYLIKGPEFLLQEEQELHLLFQFSEI